MNNNLQRITKYIYLGFAFLFTFPLDIDSISLERKRYVLVESNSTLRLASLENS